MSKKGKGKNKGYRASATYNRASLGLQKNYSRQAYKEAGLKTDISKERKRLAKYLKISGATWVVIFLALTIPYRFNGAIVALLLGIVGASFWLLYLSHFERKTLKAYISLGVPKNEYLSELARRRVPSKRLVKVSKTWDKAEKKAGDR